LPRKSSLPSAVCVAGVSVPSLELLLAQPADRQKAIIGNAPVKVASGRGEVGLDAVSGPNGAFVGMHGFGPAAGQGPLQALRNYRRGDG